MTISKLITFSWRCGSARGFAGSISLGGAHMADFGGAVWAAGQ